MSDFRAAAYHPARSVVASEPTIDPIVCADRNPHPMSVARWAMDGPPEKR